MSLFYLQGTGTQALTHASHVLGTDGKESQALRQSTDSGGEADVLKSKDPANERAALFHPSSRSQGHGGITHLNGIFNSDKTQKSYKN